MEYALDLLKELTSDPKMMWVVGGGSVVSENHATASGSPRCTVVGPRLRPTTGTSTCN